MLINGLNPGVKLFVWCESSSANSLRAVVDDWCFESSEKLFVEMLCDERLA